MYKKILVPLDGSQLAEAVLPHAEALAKTEGAEIVLLSVPVSPSLEFLARNPSLANKVIEETEAETQAYLKLETAKLAKDGVKVTSVMREGLIPEMILKVADEVHADMIAMSTHGRSGVRRWLMGSNHRCTFCIIPALRGDLVSRPVHEVMAEAEKLVESGVKELLVISQDTSAYGVDVKYRTGFWNGRPLKTRMTDLAVALGSLGVWTRLHYVYPYQSVDEVIPLMAEGKILPYLDIPFQHANARILKAMRRPASSENMLKRIQDWRAVCPDLTIRSTFIVGFPGETEEEFEELLDFIEAAQLDRVGAFKYSPVEGAEANDLGEHIDPEVQEDRLARLMYLQEEISAEKLAKKVGKVVQVLIDDVDEDGSVGRTAADAPEIDGLVYIDDEQLEVGEFVMVRITDSDEHDLWGEVVR